MHLLRIGSYYEIPVTDYGQPPLFTSRDFYSFRNHVIRLLRVFGTAGPLGEVDFSAAEEDQPSFHSEVIDDPDFFVVNDMYNEHDKISRVECSPSRIDAVLVESLAAMMQTFPGWYVSFGFGDSGLVVFSDTVLVGGRRFWDCASVTEISERCQKPVDFGPSELLPESMNYLWRDILTGAIGPTMRFPEASSRQWAEIIRSLEAMRSQRKDSRLTTFAYNQIRDDLHPLTRLELLRRILPDLPTFSQEQLAAMKRNLQKDLGKALADSTSPREARMLAAEIWLSLEAVRGGFSSSGIVNWWADLLHEVEQPSDWLKEVLEDELRNRATQSDPLFQLSALFGLAWLGADDISFYVDAAITDRPEWKSNPMLVKWLKDLRAKRRSYPDRNMLNPST